MLTPGLSFLSQTRGRRQQPARHPPPPRPPHPCLAPSAQPSDERAREARGASGQGEALAMSSFVACLQPTLDGATASKLILVIRVQLGTESFLQHLPIPNPAQLNYSIYFFQAQMRPEQENELLFNYNPAFNILWPILSHVYLHPLSPPVFF